MHLALLFLLSMVLPWAAVSAEAVDEVYLIQNSGWMEPFFSDEHSRFRPMLKALVATTHIPDTEITIASFNQRGQLPDRDSPFVIFRDRYDRGGVGRAIDGVDLPRRANGRFTDADLFGALVATIKDLLKLRPGIIWMVTNNKSAPDNAPNVIENTKKFNAALGTSPHIKQLYAFPVRMSVQGRYFKERGLIVYAIAYGEAARTELDRIVKRDGVRALFTDPPVRLKHLDAEPLRFQPSQILTPGVTARMHDGRLVLAGIDADQGGTIELRGRLLGDYYPYVIRHADTRLEWTPVEGGPEQAGIVCQIAPATLQQFKPLEILDDARIRIDVPSLPRPPGWRGLLVENTRLDGDLDLRLEQVDLGLDPTFEEKMNTLFGLDQLLPIFFQHRQVQTASTVIPVALVAHYSVWPLVERLGLATLLLVALVVLVWLLFRRRSYSGTLNGRQFHLRMRPFTGETLHGPDGTALAKIRALPFGRPRVVPLAEGVRVDLY